MLFNSIPFIFFILIVFVLYVLLDHKGQNTLLLIASFIFYGAWDWRFLILLIVSITSDYFISTAIVKTKSINSRRGLLALSIIIGFGILGFFKYFNFFVTSFSALTQSLHLPLSLPLIQVVLPVGISFYTFQTMSYVVDVYRGEAKPAKSWKDFALFVSFFPQLVAGPIERFSALYSQIIAPRIITSSKITQGFRLFLWGLFKKVVIADNAANLANYAFAHYAEVSSLTLLIGVYAFAIQIYGDFSGYSDMARGLAKLFGFELMINFKAPYLAISPSDFWKRWHISLSTWLRDYLYIPLGGNRKGELCTYRNLLLTMLLGGLWHGANWTFVFWGLFHGLLLAGHRLYLQWRGLASKEDKPSALWRIIRIFIMFQLTCIGWVFFRAENLGQAFSILSKIFIQLNAAEIYHFVFFSPMTIITLPISFAALFLYGMNHYQGGSIRWALANAPKWTQSAVYGALIALILIFAPLKANQFIYFQF